MLGNGFSIDLMNQLKLSDKISLTNLFAAGSDVPWPATDNPGFLSFQNCPNLWTLGARPYLKGEDSLRIIEDVITCANILPQRTEIKDKIYIRAYNELEQYLMSLFIHYTSMVKVKKDKIKDWGWIKYLRFLASSKNVKNVNIVSFNYDVWLELVLELYGIPFSIAGLSDKKEKFHIFKPHGSIAFQSRKRYKSAYSIQYRDSFDNHPLSDFKYDNKNLDCLNLVNAIIPPAGDSTRMRQMWSSELRNQIKMAATSLGKDDSVVICGLSYWHVDRKEIDTYLSAISPEIENLIMVNPNPPEVLNAVLMTLFNQYIVIPDSKNLIKYEKI